MADGRAVVEGRSASGRFIQWLSQYAIWGFAFGYFACYVPYSFLTKVMTKGLYSGLQGERVAGFSLLPLSVMASFAGMLVFLTAMGWWRYASHSRVLGVNVPHPTRWTFLSGLCTGGIIVTTTMAYTFDGVSIVFAMLLMRGGVLVIAPMVDLLARRHVRWFSWAGLACALAALTVSLADTDSYTIPLVCGIDIALYLSFYFIRLRFMSHIAKSEDGDANRRYFVEEQLVASPAMVILLILVALLGRGEMADLVRAGFTEYLHAPHLWLLVLLGLFSQGTGIFGSLIFLDKRENTFCVPVNRSSSILAGVIASYLLLMFPGQHPPGSSQLIGAGLVLLAIVFLTVPPALARRRPAAASPA